MGSPSKKKWSRSSELSSSPYDGYNPPISPISVLGDVEGQQQQQQHQQVILSIVSPPPASTSSFDIDLVCIVDGSTTNDSSIEDGNGGSTRTAHRNLSLASQST
jgi:hypothetical protein